MKKVIIALATLGLAIPGGAASADQSGRDAVSTGTLENVAQGQRGQRADVQTAVTDAAGRTVGMEALQPIDRQRLTSLQRSLQDWGNQQPQRVKVTIRCTYPPLRCEITISF
jgi:hypothetical protein